ncbi:aldose epimerase family protein [Paradevosia shaoguanensis]|uniref:aldose epimerase family protein n=1 Tax=Paradevosia shaoguanensis TaxID=1335043 RepID=UPI003C73D267
MTIAVSTFGEHQGKRVDQFRLTSETGVEVDIIGYGVAVRDWRVPVAGKPRSVVLGFDDFGAYPAHSPHFGAVAGRVANRIAGASFEIDGKTCHVPANEGGASLHGGPEGLGRQVWQGEADNTANSVRFTFFSPDGAAGYPGNVNFAATYTLKGNRLRLDFAATTDRKTPISLVQHQYFNLSGAQTILDHRFQMAASAYTENGEDLLPTGVIRPVDGTKWDFRTSKSLRDASGQPIAFDGNLVLDSGRDLNQPIATVTGDDGALTLKLWTDRPGVQFYNGVYTDMPVPGLSGRTYKNFSGFCLEDQAFPDAMHHPYFPNILYSPDRPYAHWCEFAIA